MAEIHVDSFHQPHTINGVPLAGAKLYFYQAGTTTPITVYSSDALTTPLTNPVIADASGIFVPVWINDAASPIYKTVLTTSDDVTVQTVDNIGSIGAKFQALSFDTIDALKAFNSSISVSTVHVIGNDVAGNSDRVFYRKDGVVNDDVENVVDGLGRGWAIVGRHKRNLFDFRGVWGGGSHDDTAGVQLAADWLLDHPQIIEVPDDVYNITGTVDFRNSSGGFQGVGRGMYQSADEERPSRFVWGGAATGTMFDFSDGVNATDGFYMGRISIDGLDHTQIVTAFNCGSLMRHATWEDIYVENIRNGWILDASSFGHRFSRTWVANWGHIAFDLLALNHGTVFDQIKLSANNLAAHVTTPATAGIRIGVNQHSSNIAFNDIDVEPWYTDYPVDLFEVRGFKWNGGYTEGHTGVDAILRLGAGSKPVDGSILTNITCAGNSATPNFMLARYGRGLDWIGGNVAGLTSDIININAGTGGLSDWDVRALNYSGTLSNVTTGKRSYIPATAGALVSLSATQAIATATATELIWGAVEIGDSNMLVSAPTTDVTIVEAGKYIISAGVRWAANNTGYRSAEILINGAGSRHGAGKDRRNTTIGVITEQSTPAVVLTLAANDTVSISVTQSSGGNLNVEANGDTFLSVQQIF